MTYIPLDSISYGDSMSLDAFTRLRTTSIRTIFESRSQYNTSPRDWSTLATGTGSVSLLTNESTVQLSTGGPASGAKIIRQTKLCWHYDQGKSQLGLMSFRIGAAVNNVRRRIGFFDENDGIFFEQRNGFFGLVLRSSSTGVVVENSIPQSSWNVDKLDGTGSSGITLDISKIQVMFFDFQGLGAGRIRVGFLFHGRYVIAHVLDSSNNAIIVGTRTTKLPFRGEIENVGVAAETATLNMIASVLMSEEGDEAFGAGKLNSASNGTTTVAATTRRPVLSIRPALTFGGIPNRAWYTLIETVLRVTTNDVFWEIVFGATLTGASWSSVTSDSSVEVDVSATALSGGISVVKGYALAGQGSSSGQANAAVAGRFPNSVDSLLGTQGGHTLVVTSMGGTANIAAAFNWREIQ